MTNALWWVRFKDQKNPALGEQLLSLSSPDLKDPRKATKRAADTAKARLKKRGVSPVVLSVRCVA